MLACFLQCFLNVSYFQRCTNFYQPMVKNEPLFTADNSLYNGDPYFIAPPHTKQSEICLPCGIILTLSEMHFANIALLKFHMENFDCSP